MDLIMEFLFELILEGSLELAGSRKIPMVLRILAAAILLAVYGGLLMLGVMLLFRGIERLDWPLMLVGLFLVLLIAFFGVKVIKKYKKECSELDKD